MEIMAVVTQLCCLFFLVTVGVNLPMNPKFGIDLITMIFLFSLGFYFYFGQWGLWFMPLLMAALQTMAVKRIGDKSI